MQLLPDTDEDPGVVPDWRVSTPFPSRLYNAVTVTEISSVMLEFVNERTVNPVNCEGFRLVVQSPETLWNHTENNPKISS